VIIRLLSVFILRVLSILFTIPFWWGPQRGKSLTPRKIESVAPELLMRVAENPYDLLNIDFWCDGNLG
jgi:hypothetical protein